MLVLKFNLKGKLQAQHTCRGSGGALRERGLGDAISAFSLCLTAAHTIIWSPDFCNSHQEIGRLTLAARQGLCLWSLRAMQIHLL